MHRWIWLLGLGILLGAQEARIQVCATSDTQGHVLSVDPYTLQPRPMGWAKLATILKEKRGNRPNTLLIDCGNALQGAPLAAIRHRTRPDLPDSSIAVMNALGWHALALGDHDFTFGMETLRRVEEQARFPFLCANLVDVKSGKPAFTPYAIQERDGIRVALLGLWAAPQAPTPSLALQDPLTNALPWVARLRNQEKADVLVLVVHGGSDPEAFQRLATLREGLHEFDLMVAGPTRPSLQSALGKLPVVQGEAEGRALGLAELSLLRDKGRWRVTSVKTDRAALDAATPLDTEVIDLTRPQREAAERYLDTFATQLQVDLDGRWVCMEDTPLAQLLHTVQRATLGAQISAIPLPPTRYFVPAGATSIRQFWALAPSEDAVARIRITGAQLKAYMEHGARMFNFSHHAELFNKTVSPQDVDVVDGPSYVLDLGKPEGQRITELKYQGRPVTPDQTFSMVLPWSRLQGRGGYLKAMGWQGIPEAVSPMAFRNALFTYILSQPTLTPLVPGLWRTLPYLDRERVMAQLP